ncbi:hypothetical protein D3C80_1464750 [compost metagenome]
MSWITPLFWLKVVIGRLLNMAATAELQPSASTPDLIRRMYSGPLTGCLEMIELAVRSPAVSSGVIRKITAIGTKAMKSKLKPYLNGCGTLISGTSAMLAKFT